MSRKVIIALALSLVVGACSGGDDTSTEETQAAVEASTADAPTDAPTLTSTSVAPTTTEPEPTTTAEETTTTTAAPTDPLVFLASEKVAMVEAAIPEDYTFETTPDEDSPDNPLFIPCLTDADFDLTQLAAVSAAAFDIEFDGPDVGIFGAASGSIEIRVFQDDDVAGEAFATLEKLLGSDAGRACVGQQMAEFMAVEMGGGVGDLCHGRAGTAAR